MKKRNKMKLFYALVEKANKVEQNSKLSFIDFCWNDTYSIVVPKNHSAQIVYMRQ